MHIKFLNMYKNLLRPLLFKLSPEFAHDMVLAILGLLRKIPLGRSVSKLFFKRSYPALKKEVFGIEFPNPVGLAAGLDKNGEYYNELSDFGFGFIEIGSLTPKPQAGNPKPRLFRLPEDMALINRMGINNSGMAKAIENIKKNKPEVKLAASISKNTTSQDAQIAKDYEACFSVLYDFVDLFVVNVSCPNVEGLCNLQDASFLSDVMDPLLDKRAGMDKYKPVLVKISLDITNDQLDEVLTYSMMSGIDGIVVGNTTKNRKGLSLDEETLSKIGHGGLSGAPLYEKSLSMVKYVHEKTGGKLPVIGVGGIMSPEQACEMLDAGASLIEIYTGFIYEGPSFVRKILQALNEKAVSI